MKHAELCEHRRKAHNHREKMKYLRNKNNERQLEGYEKEAGEDYD
jgi:hypothetical protein